MSQENVEIVRVVRIPLVPETRRHRTLDERIVVRFPALARWLAAASARLPHHSRLRRAMLARSVRREFAAVNRRDFAFVLTSLHPELVYHPRADEPDPSPHVGRDAYERLVNGFVDSFSEVTFEVLEVIDAGDHVITSTVLHAVLHGQGNASGAGVSDTYVFVYKLRDGLVAECWEYRTKQEALKAVGLSEQDAHADSS
jgi:ketosteroid isomerase-like protein